MVTWFLETENRDTSGWTLPSWLEKVLPRLSIVAEEPTTTRNLVATRPCGLPPTSRNPHS